MTSSRSPTPFLASNWFLDGSAREGFKLLARDVSQSKVTFPAVDVLVVSGRFVTKPSERIVAAFLSEHGLTLDMCMFHDPVVLRKAMGQSVFTEKSNELLKKDFLARLQRFFTCPTTISRVRRSLVERDQGQSSQEYDLACLGPPPNVQNGSSLQGNKQNVLIHLQSIA